MMTAGVNLVLSIWLITPFGITGVIAGTVLAYILCNIIPAWVNTIYLLKKLSYEL